MAEKHEIMAPESSAARVALWRALHLDIDAAPPVVNDRIGLQLLAPPENWRERPDMHPQGTRGYRASIVGRARLLDDLVMEKCAQGIRQYVILGAGLDSFAQRHKDLAGRLRIFEVDQAGPQKWKQLRLTETGLGLASHLVFVPVDFESGSSWWERLIRAGFDLRQPAVLSSTGVSMYLSREAVVATLQQVARLAPGSVLAMTYLLPLELIPDAEERAQHEAVYERAKAAGTPFTSFFAPDEILQLAREAGFRTATSISTEELIKRYFANRTDGLRPATGESILLAGT